jgi:uncharacterized repeat protein (TIGR01451 family)
LGLAATLAILTSAFVLSPVAAVPGNDSTVLILGSTVSGGASSREATAAVGLGLTVEVVSDGTWSEMTAEEFASYRAIILGDATCGGSPSVFTANQATWGPGVDGNVVLIGTDPIFHQSQGGGTLTDKGVAFAVDEAGKTGLYATLSCYYHGTGSSTPVPGFNSLSGAGDFTVTGVGCYNDAHIVAAHPALDGLTDANLSDWSCSVHEAFDSWPSDFQVLAIAEGVGTYVASDGTTGTPYILARGEGLVAIGSTTRLPPSLTIDKSYTGNSGGDVGGVPLSKVGDVLTFTLAYTIVNPPVTGGIITDVLPAGLDYVAGSATTNAWFTAVNYDAGTRTLTWTAPIVSTNGSVTYQTAVTATGSQSIDNVTVIDSAQTTPDDGKDTVHLQQVLAETSRPQITLPPTSTANQAGTGSAGASLGLILLILSGIGIFAGLLVPARARIRR